MSRWICHVSDTAIYNGVLSMDNGYSLRTFKGDFFGGLTAGVVALPLALAFGVASGFGAVAGLYGAIALGFLLLWQVVLPLRFRDPPGQ